MKIAVFLNGLGLGGTEKAACLWAQGLKDRGHTVSVLALEDGPRRKQLEDAGISLFPLPPVAPAIAEALRQLAPEVIHTHVPGYPHKGDVLGEALALLPKIPVVSTNIFGRLENARENAWTDFRLFISWTSCVQAARRSFIPLDNAFFENCSVASYPLDPDDGPDAQEILAFRRQHGIAANEVLFGRISRPEPNKWTDLALDAFRIAARRTSHIKLLLREPPPEVARQISAAPDGGNFIVLPATADPGELRLTMASLDAVLHTSVIGESFGYGIAEPMNFAKPVIANSTPWLDQAQIELVRHGECGFIASTPPRVADAILKLANDIDLRNTLGRNAQAHIRKLADPIESTTRLERALTAAVTGSENPHVCEDMEKARAAAAYLDEQQFGHSLHDQLALRPHYYRVRFHQCRRSIRRANSLLH